ncbi:hypothetical protein ACJOV8_013340 [Formosa sp. 3Alg 14/1]|uniref:hypothetical protein n=1 Tax=Formosa sp. 3Alg 14/1 TaxID=3382190 RepID=UPI0039BDEFD9
MDILKQFTKVILYSLGVLILISAVFGDLVLLFGLLFGILFIYYFLLYQLIKWWSKKDNNWSVYVVSLFFVIPLLWGIIDWESLFNFLLQWIHLDMRH